MIKKVALTMLISVFLITSLCSCARITVKNDEGSSSEEDEAISSTLPSQRPSDDKTASALPDSSDKTAASESPEPSDETPATESAQPDEETPGANSGDYIIADSNTRRYEYFEICQLFDMDPAQASFARNEIFARHGHVFDNKYYQDYFSRKSWYKPDKKVAFDELNEFEQYNSKLLLFYEKGFQGSIPPGSKMGELPSNPSWLVHNLMPDEQFKVDLNGDGSKETVSWSRNIDNEAVIKVGKITAGVPATNSGNWGDYVAIVDLDPGDSYKELIICDMGPSDDDWSYVYEFRNGKLNMIGEASGNIQYGSLLPDGKGGISASTRANLLQTWFYRKDFKLNSSHKLEAAALEYYPTCYQLFLKNSVTLFKSRDFDSRPFKAKGGQAALLSATDDKTWCRLTLEDGTEGWFAVDNFMHIVKDDASADEIFDNLCYAD